MENPFDSTEITCLDFYQPSFKHHLENYFLPEEQIRYTAHPLEAILKCEEVEDRHPILILHKNLPAGFFVLHGWEGVKEYSDNKKALLLRAYSVNSIFQGKGIAKESLRLLPSFVMEHFPQINEIILAVNQKNIVAQHVYKKGGFVDKGVRAMGSKGPLIIMQKNLFENSLKCIR